MKFSWESMTRVDYMLDNGIGHLLSFTTLSWMTLSMLTLTSASTVLIVNDNVSSNSRSVCGFPIKRNLLQAQPCCWGLLALQWKSLSTAPLKLNNNNIALTSPGMQTLAMAATLSMSLTKRRSWRLPTFSEEGQQSRRHKWAISEGTKGWRRSLSLDWARRSGQGWQ